MRNNRIFAEHIRWRGRHDRAEARDVLMLDLAGNTVGQRLT